MTSKPNLSIIIPCYNCSATLEEAVISCYTQNLSNFEIIMVNDGSTDNTQEIMEFLAAKYKEIKIFNHETNRGGGATRNTAVSKAQSDVIFCLDSDDILPDRTLPKMLTLLSEKQLDGVLFEETRFFYNFNIKKTEIVKNIIKNKLVEINDLFIEGNGFLTKVNFLYTKKAFAIAGEYPVHHGFDTQTFGLKFLYKKLKVEVCEGTYYLHRRNRVNTSYFGRENALGKLSYNSYLMYEDVIDFFSDKTIYSIINFDILHKNKLGGDNFEKELLKDFAAKQNRIETGKNIEIFKMAVKLHKENKFEEASTIYRELISIFPSSQILYINLLRSCLYESINGKTASIENTIYKTLSKKPEIYEKNIFYKIIKKLIN